MLYPNPKQSGPPQHWYQNTHYSEFKKVKIQGSPATILTAHNQLEKFLSFLQTYSCILEPREGSAPYRQQHLPGSGWRDRETWSLWGHCFVCSRIVSVLADISKSLSPRPSSLCSKATGKKQNKNFPLKQEWFIAIQFISTIARWFFQQLSAPSLSETGLWNRTYCQEETTKQIPSSNSSMTMLVKCSTAS